MLMYREYGDCTTEICGLAVSDPLLPVNVPLIPSLSSSFVDAKSSLDVHSVGVSEHTQRTLAWGGREVIFAPPKKCVQFCTQITKSRIFGDEFSKTNKHIFQNIARIANAVQCHN